MEPAIIPALPEPRCQISIRPATLADVPFMDSLQKKYNKALGYFPTRQFEGYVETGGVLIAEEAEEDRLGLGAGLGGNPNLNPHLNLNHLPLGYIISRDRYLKRDELGVVFQLCVAPGTQRKLVGAALVREAFERSAYGCKLYCCWCAQDLDANYFWESLGFLPIAFRAGSDKKRRVHIFWQRRIIEGDVVTPYWYPFQTSAGAMGQDRLVFPIPPGVHWKEVEAVALPTAGLPTAGLPTEQNAARAPRPCRLTGSNTGGAPVPRVNERSKIRKSQGPSPGKVGILVGGRIKYIDRPGYVAPRVEPAPPSSPSTALALVPTTATVASIPALPAPTENMAAVNAPASKPHAPPAAAVKKAKPRRPAAKVDPKYVAAARELRDRYLEKYNLPTAGLTNAGLMSAGLTGGKYAVSKSLPQPARPAFGYNPKTKPLAA